VGVDVGVVMEVLENSGREGSLDVGVVAEIRDGRGVW
jgi:hypothetical protein